MYARMSDEVNDMKADRWPLMKDLIENFSLHIINWLGKWSLILVLHWYSVPVSMVLKDTEPVVLVME